MFDEMTERSFVEFLAALWESRGWETAITERDEGVYMVTGDKADGSRGLMLVIPGRDETVTGQLLQKAVSLVQDKGIETAVAATRGTFSEDARGVADANGVHLLDPEALEKTVAAEDVHDLVEEHSSGGGGGVGGSLMDRLSDVGLQVPDGAGVPGRLQTLFMGVLAVAVVLGAIQFLGIGTPLSGVIGALPLPEVGFGAGGGGYTITAVSLSAGNATPVPIAWNARQQSRVVAPNGEAYTAPDGQQFVVVQLNITNPTAETLVFRSNYLALATNNTRYGNQPLQAASGQLPVQIEAGASVDAYVVYSVPEDTESGTLIGLPGSDIPPMTFERDRSMSFQVEGE